MNIATAAALMALLSSISPPQTAFAQPPAHPASPARIAVLGAMPPLTNSEDAESVAALLRNRGDDVAVLSPVQLTDVNSFSAARYQLLIVPHCDVFPALAEANLQGYLKAKGRLLCLGGPAFSRIVFSDGRAWMTRHELLSNVPSHAMTDRMAADLSLWTRATANPAGSAAIKREESPHGSALHLRFDSYKDWDNFGPPKFTVSPFKPGETLTSFWAKGDADTHALVMEWDETDGSRWIAAVPITEEWRRVTLEPSEFHYWNDNASRGRGVAGDHLNPAAAAVLRIGLAQSHAAMSSGPHQFWIADLGSASLPSGFPRPSAAPLVLEGLAPLHKQVHDKTSDLWLPVLRDRGIGLSGPRTGRLIPVDLSPPAYPTANSAYSQWVRLSLAGPYTGAIWGGIAEFHHEGAKSTVDPQPTIDRVLQNVFLISAGAEFAAYKQGDPVQTGAIAINIGPRNSVLHVVEELDPIAANSAPGSLCAEVDVTLLPGEQKQIGQLGQVRPPAAGEWRYKIVVSIGGAKIKEAGGYVLDRIEMPIRIVPAITEHANPDDLVHVLQGEFIRNGKPFRPVGINYWPLTVAGQEPPAYHRGWLSPEQYEPDLVEQDLVRCESIGINLVSIQYLRSDQGPALIDFMARCRNHHILVNVFVADADPRNLNITAVNSLLEAARLDHCSDLFAFDIAWEPHLGRHADRTRFDAEWRHWVDLNYGGVENAEADWKFSAPRLDGELTNPEDAQVSSDGSWRIMVAAYRRFVDEMLSHEYRAVIQALRHRGAMIGARSGYGGNGFSGVDPEMPFDLLSGAAHLDFISPEGYGLGGDWQEFRAGGFTAAYARWAGAGKPVFWAEFGSSVYPNTDADRLAIQADVVDKMYRMVVDSGSNGSAAWWFPGGLRLDENSDFGMFEPSGAERPAAKRVRIHAQTEMPSAIVAPTGDATLTGDRDSDARGFTGVNMRLRAEYAHMRETGKYPVFSTRGTGTTTANMPLEAVGSVSATGSNPLKYALAEIFVDTEDPDSVELLNTGDAIWTAAGAGRVELVITAANGVSKTLAIPGDTPRYGSCRLKLSAIRATMGGATSVKCRLAVAGRLDAPAGVSRLPFGEHITLQINQIPPLVKFLEGRR